jgi:hypothetical protein
MNVAMWEHCTTDNQVFDVVKFTTLIPLSLLIPCKLFSFLPVGLKIFSLPTSGLKTPYKLFMWYFGK